MQDKTDKLTLGTVQLGLDYGIANDSGKPSLEKSFEILDTAVNGGIISFDTAAAYGNSEEILGRYFAQNSDAKKDAIITTKVSTRKEVDLSKVQSIVSDQIENSLKNLQIEKVDYLMLHAADDLYAYKTEIVKALLRAKNEGLAKEVGVSVYTTHDIKEVLKYDGLSCVQLPINIMDVRLIKTGILAELKKRGVFVFARSVFLQGIFFKDVNTLIPELMCAKKYINKLNKVCEEYNISMAELALSYVRDIDGIDSLVLGAEESYQVIENIKLINSKGIPQSKKDELFEFFDDVPEFVLNPGLWVQYMNKK